MSVLTTHRFTVEDYYRMAETGVLKPEARVELLDGEIVDMMPIGPFHAGTTNRLNRLFNVPSKGRWLVAAQNPVRLSEHSEPQSDLMLVKPALDDYTRRHPGPDDVFLLIEVADTTLTYDRSRKLPAYGRAGIPEVWIVNLPERKVEVYREPHYLGYAFKLELREGDQAEPQAFPDVKVDVASLLRVGGERP
ncbi:MAG: Uma2 family endonuclease [Verrucomicrobia bacterium]|nr:Uma2 family endonuclease [Verrucomicrobiota bacterium]